MLPQVLHVAWACSHRSNSSEVCQRGMRGGAREERETAGTHAAAASGVRRLRPRSPASGPPPAPGTWPPARRSAAPGTAASPPSRRRRPPVRARRQPRPRPVEAAAHPLRHGPRAGTRRTRTSGSGRRPSSTGGRTAPAGRGQVGRQLQQQRRQAPERQEGSPRSSWIGMTPTPAPRGTAAAPRGPVVALRSVASRLLLVYHDQSGNPVCAGLVGVSLGAWRSTEEVLWTPQRWRAMPTPK